MDALHNPSGTRKYSRAKTSTDIPDTQKADIDLGLDRPVVHGEALANVAGDVNQQSDYLAALAFNEEPVRIIIEENSRSELPETHVPVAVQGTLAEVLINGKWAAIGWLPVGQELVTKRKYVEVLLRAKTDVINTVHDNADVERPRNDVKRRTSAPYPVTVLQDDNPKGREWLVRCRTAH